MHNVVCGPVKLCYDKDSAMTDFDYGSKNQDGQYQNHPSLPEDLPQTQPVRFKYDHLKCSGQTRVPEVVAKTYARNPKFYSSTFCCTCKDYFPVSEFVWSDCHKPIGEPTG